MTPRVLYHRTIQLNLALISVGLFLCSGDAQELPDELVQDPALAPEECGKQSPDELHRQLEQHTPGKLSAFYFSIGGTDTFYDAYAIQLQKLTTHDYPETNAFRQPLLRSFGLCMDYIARVSVGRNLGHERARLPARLEWVLYQGAHTGYRFAETSERQTDADWPDYRPELIEQIAVAFGQASLNTKYHRFDGEIRPVLQQSLAQLAEAEHHMDDKQKRFFRHQFVLLMSRYF